LRYQRFGRTQLRVSAVSLGGAYLGGAAPEHAEENAHAIVRRALDMGCNYIDTAPLYGDSERLLGLALARENRPPHVATKVGFRPEGFDYGRDVVLGSLERSLHRLGLEKLTVAQIHEVNKAGWERIMEPGGTLEGMREAQKRGLCEFVGITGRAIPLLARLASTGEFDTILCYHDYHPCVPLAAEEVLPAAAEHDMGVVMATVLAGGIYVEEEGQQESVEKRFDTERERKQAWETIEALRGKDSTLPQSAFRWVLADDRVSTVSSGAATVAQWEEVALAADMVPLSHHALNLHSGN
jgi:aryl-alcohol dehydrogenase-like predicted oxidoreductase